LLLMATLNSTVVSGFVDRFSTLAARVRELAAPLSEEQFWQKPFPFGNSFGHLVLHLTGNLNYYIGAQIAASGYVRDRNREFTDAQPPAKEEALTRFEAAVARVLEELRGQSDEDWAKPYTAKGLEGAGNRFNAILNCATHLHHHIGQMMYLNFEFTRKK
jgi:uncharacterized damage-inducible protein DinB